MEKMGGNKMVNKIKNELSQKEFLTDYAKKPLLLEGIADSWKATQIWSLEYLKEKYGDKLVLIRKCNHIEISDLYETTLGEYIDYLKVEGQEENPWYCTWSFMENCKEIYEDYNSIEIFKDNWIDYIPRGEMNDCKWLFIGPKGSGTPLHLDFAMTSAWNAVITGRKKWIFFSPEDSKYMYEGMVDAFNPNLEKFPEFSKANPIIVYQNPGDIVYTPSGWWHQVINLEDGISITENFINKSNAKTAIFPYIKLLFKKNEWTF